MLRMQDVQKTIYLLYLFCLIFGKVGFLSTSNIVTRYFLINLSSVLMYIGLILIIVTSHGEIKYAKKIQIVFYQWSYMAIASIVMALVLYFPLDTLYGETTFRAIAGDCIYYFVLVLGMYYNLYCITRFVTIKDIENVFIIQSVCLLCIGYLQLMVIMGIRPVITIYNAIREPLVLVKTNILYSRGVCFGGSEASSASHIVIYTLSLLFATFISNNDKNTRVKIIIIVLLFIPLFLTTTSSSVVICITILIISLIILIISHEKVYKFAMIGAFLIGLTVAIIYTFGDPTNYVMTEGNESSFKYLLLGKIFNINDDSTILRSSSIINDMEIFRDYFVTGVGNGIQGFFYSSNIPSWTLRSYEVKMNISGVNGVGGGGGAFFPTYLSAFGLIGIGAVIIFLKEYIRLYKSNHKRRNTLSIFFLFAITQFLASGWLVTGIIQSQWMAFLLAIPFVQESTLMD